MKKKLFCLVLSALGILGVVACSENDNPTTAGSQTTGSQNTTTSGGMKEDLFKGDWNKPGLYNKEGQAHTLTKLNVGYGMEINVTDYGAKPNDETFDNYSAFNSAIENAQPGDIIYVPDGTYNFKNYGRASSDYYAQIILKDGLTLMGESENGVIIKSCFSEKMNKDNSTTVISAVNVKHVLIKNIVVTSNTSDDELPDPNNSNLQTTTYTAPKYGITCATSGSITTEEDETKYIQIENCTVEKFQRMGVRVAMAQEVVVKNSTFQKATCLGGGGMGYGVNIQGYGPDVDVTDSAIDTRYNIVEDCKFVGPYLRHGALVQYSSHNNLIKNNYFENLLLDSIDMHGEDEYSNEICDNEIINTRKGAGIGLGNTGATHDASGRNNYIHNNVINNGDRGIDVILGTPNTVIENNTITNVNKGITCSNANGTIITKNTIKNVKNNAVSITYAYNPDKPELGIPNNYIVTENKFESCGKGIYIDSKGDSVVLKPNEYISMALENQLIDESGSFVLPEKSTLTQKVDGDYVLPLENFYITMESPDKPATYQKNLKLKTSNLEPKYNRIIYALFDKNQMPKEYNRVYLAFSAKAQVGTPTLNFFVNQTYTDWTTDTICWNNSKLHHETLGLIKNTEEDPVTEFLQFTFPVANYEFQTYYVDVTDVYEQIKAGLFTMVITNENIDESYMEIYSNQQTANDCEQAFRFIFS